MGGTGRAAPAFRGGGTRSVVQSLPGELRLLDQPPSQPWQCLHGSCCEHGLMEGARAGQGERVLHLISSQQNQIILNIKLIFKKGTL